MTILSVVSWLGFSKMGRMVLVGVGLVAVYFYIYSKGASNAIAKLEKRAEVHATESIRAGELANSGDPYKRLRQWCRDC